MTFLAVRPLSLIQFGVKGPLKKTTKHTPTENALIEAFEAQHQLSAEAIDIVSPTPVNISPQEKRVCLGALLEMREKARVLSQKRPNPSTLSVIARVELSNGVVAEAFNTEHKRGVTQSADLNALTLAVQQTNLQLLQQPSQEASVPKVTRLLMADNRADADLSPDELTQEVMTGKYFAPETQVITLRTPPGQKPYIQIQTVAQLLPGVVNPVPSMLLQSFFNLKLTQEAEAILQQSQGLSEQQLLRAFVAARKAYQLTGKDACCLMTNQKRFTATTFEFDESGRRKEAADKQAFLKAFEKHPGALNSPLVFAYYGPENSGPNIEFLGKLARYLSVNGKASQDVLIARVITGKKIELKRLSEYIQDCYTRP